MTRTILYLHGMGGGSSSRIPNLLSQWFTEEGIPVRVVCRTYPFDPAEAHPLIRRWVEELRPDLLIGESLGSIHALRIPEIPKLLVSPALGGPRRLVQLAPWSLLPGFDWICRRFVWHVKSKYPDRQRLCFRPAVLRRYGPHYAALLENLPHVGSVHAFIGTRDHYLKSKVVDVALWKNLYGADTLTRYEGTHYMEEEPLRTLLVPAILRITANL